MSKVIKIVRAWTIYAAPCIVRRVMAAGTGGNARLFDSAGCTLYPEEQVVTEAERLLQACDTPGGAIYWRNSKVERIDWRPIGAKQARSFMPNAPSTWADLQRPGYWAQLYAEAGDALIAFLKQNPKP